MNKSEFMRQLKKELRKRNVNDIPEILADYEEHFAAAIDEKTEQEIVEELGSPFQIADEYAINRYSSNTNVQTVYKKIQSPRIGLIILLIFFDLIFGIAIASIIFSLVVSLAAVALSCIAGGCVWAVFSFFVFGAVAIKFAGFFVALAVVFLGLVAAFSVKPATKGVIHLGKQYIKLHRVILGGKA